MKKSFTLLLLFFSVFVFAQKTMKITQQNKHISKKSFYLKLKNVFDDSRCPTGVTCIWAGEVSAIVAVYRDKKCIEEKSITFNTANLIDNIKWFENYIPKKIKEIWVMPYPEKGIIVKPKKQYMAVSSF